MVKSNESASAHKTWYYEITMADIDGGGDMEYTTYGIKAMDSDAHVAAAYADVSTSKAFVQQIVDKCNQFDADVIHLEDILLDEIG